jgi:2-methylcitrate dehydratase
MAMRGEMGYPSALRAKQWGFYDVLFKSNAFSIPRKYGHYVMENILFKIAFPAEFHAQTAIEAAIKLYPQVKNQWENIDKIILTTHESAIRIINKTGVLYNPADRDHCLQYIVAIGLLYGELTAEHYEESTAKDPRIDELRNKMIVEEDKLFSQDYLDPEKRSIANAIEIYFKNGTKTDKIRVDYPLGHRQRRQEATPLLIRKFKNALKNSYAAEKIEELENNCLTQAKLETLKIAELMDMLAK